MNDTVQRALVARIEQLEAENSALGDQCVKHRARIRELETILNNVWSSIPEKVQETYQGWRR